MIPPEDIDRSVLERDRAAMLSGVKSAVNSHGLAFQHSVIAAACQARDQGHSRWAFQVTEFPARLDGSNTHIDLVLQHDHEPWLLVGECKRAHPTFSRWVFFRTPRTAASHRIERLHIDQVETRQNDQCFVTPVRGGVVISPSFSSAVALKRHQASIEPWECPASKEERQAPVEAVDQALRGTNGLINYWNDSRRGFAPAIVRIASFVVTTAQLWTCDVDVSAGSLADGNIEIPPESLAPCPWIHFLSATSTELRHSASARGPSDPSLSGVLASRYLRSVFIVQSLRLGEFLRWLGPDTWLDLGPPGSSTL